MVWVASELLKQMGVSKGLRKCFYFSPCWHKDKGLDQPHAAIEVAEICLCSAVQCEDFLVGISRKDIKLLKGAGWVRLLGAQQAYGSFAAILAALVALGLHSKGHSCFCPAPGHALSPPREGYPLAGEVDVPLSLPGWPGQFPRHISCILVSSERRRAVETDQS